MGVTALHSTGLSCGACFQGQAGLIKPPVSKEGEQDGSEGDSGGAGGGEKRKRRKRRKKYDFSEDLAAREEDEKRLAQEASTGYTLILNCTSITYPVQQRSLMRRKYEDASAEKFQ